MQIYLDRPRLLVYAIITGFCAAGTWVAFALLLAHEIRGAVFGAVVGGAIVLTLYTGFYLRSYLKKRHAVVSITKGGIAFDIPGIGKIGWDQIVDAEVRKLGIGRSLAVYVREPAPVPGRWSGALYGLTRRTTRKGVRFALPIGRLRASESEIEAAIAEHRPA